MYKMDWDVGVVDHLMQDSLRLKDEEIRGKSVGKAL